MSPTAEALVATTVSSLSRLQLECVPVAWVDQVQDGQFTESVDLPAEYEDTVGGVDVSEVLGELRQAAAHWVRLYGEELDATGSIYRKGFWTILTSEHNVRHPVLLALLFYYMDKGQEQVT